MNLHSLFQIMSTWDIVNQRSSGTKAHSKVSVRLLGREEIRAGVPGSWWVWQQSGRVTLGWNQPKPPGKAVGCWEVDWYSNRMEHEDFKCFWENLFLFTQHVGTGEWLLNHHISYCVFHSFKGVLLFSNYLINSKPGVSIEFHS